MKEQKNNNIQSNLNLIDIIMEIFGWLLLCAIWVFTIRNFSEMPDIIPIHYDFLGHADRFGPKEKLFDLLIVVSILFVGLTILSKFPNAFCFFTKKIEENIKNQYFNPIRIIRYTKLTILIFISMIVFNNIYTREENYQNLGVWFGPLFLILIFIPLGYPIIKSLKLS